MNDGAGTGVIHKDRRKRDWIQLANDAVEIERLEAYFSGRGYEQHRHDSYAIGYTISGVQSFHYRGALRNNIAGPTTMVLHPDEVHDGQAGADDGFHYRMVYIYPAQIQDVLGGKPLPFIKDGISTDPRLYQATAALLPSPEHRFEKLEYEDAIFDLTQALNVAAGFVQTQVPRIIDYKAAERARDYLEEEPENATTLQRLEEISGRDRWRLSRDFRLLYGTSPHRYLVMRRLARVRFLLRNGTNAAQASVAAGFTDQSHMIRHFTKTFGVSPARWLSILSK